MNVRWLAIVAASAAVASVCSFGVAEGWLVGNQNGSPVQDAYVICAK